jgi:hypothetical protein
LKSIPNSRFFGVLADNEETRNESAEDMIPVFHAKAFFRRAPELVQYISHRNVKDLAHKNWPIIIAFSGRSICADGQLLIATAPVPWAEVRPWYFLHRSYFDFGRFLEVLPHG